MLQTSLVGLHWKSDKLHKSEEGHRKKQCILSFAVLQISTQVPSPVPSALIKGTDRKAENLQKNMQTPSTVFSTKLALMLKLVTLRTLETLVLLNAPAGVSDTFGWSHCDQEYVKRDTAWCRTTYSILVTISGEGKPAVLLLLAGNQLFGFQTDIFFSLSLEWFRCANQSGAGAIFGKGISMGLPTLVNFPYGFVPSWHHDQSPSPHELSVHAVSFVFYARSRSLPAQSNGVELWGSSDQFYH